MLWVSRKDTPHVAWSDDIHQADWISERLDEGGLNSVVPGGFASYARLFHPVQRRHSDAGVVRWAEVAAWSGRALRPGSEFHSVAFPVRGTSAPPWSGSGPRSGTMDGEDMAALIAVLRSHTTTPEACWFGLWEGYGWLRGGVLATSVLGDPSDEPTIVPGPIPQDILNGPKVELPDRNYLLFTGRVEDALAFVESRGQTPNLFWPSDHAWCVASEIDLSSTYVGGSEDLVNDLLASDELEALAIEESTPIFVVEPWIEEEAASAAEALLVSGNAKIETSLGTVHAELRRYGFLGRKVALITSSTLRNGDRGGHSPLGNVSGEELRTAIEDRLARTIVYLAE